MAVAAGALALVVTHPTVAFTVDSGEYLAVADGVRSGEGLTMAYLSYDEPYDTGFSPGDRVPMTQFPPLYPLLMAALGAATGLDTLATARAVGTLLFAATVALTVELVRRAGGLVAAVLAGALVLGSRTLLTVHAMAWSEPVLLFLTVVGLTLLWRGSVGADRRWIYGALVTLGLAASARFVGIGLLAGAMVIAVAVCRPRSGRERLALLGWMVLSVVPLAAWTVRTSSLLGGPSERPLRWHPPLRREVDALATAVGRWLALPAGPALPVGQAILLGLVLAGAWATVNVVRSRAVTVPQACAVLGLGYLAVVYGARALIDVNAPFDSRIMSPLQLAVIIGLASKVSELLRGVRRSRSPAVLVGGVGVLVVAVIAWNGVGSGLRLLDTPEAGYASPGWRRSSGLDAVAELPADVAVITNAPDPVWHDVGRVTRFLPLETNIYTAGPNPRYRDQLEALRRASASRAVVIVFFDRPSRGRVRHLGEVPIDVLGAREVRRLGDATVYCLEGSVCPRI